jgi:peptide/nickel transport system permease protein
MSEFATADTRAAASVAERGSAPNRYLVVVRRVVQKPFAVAGLITLIVLVAASVFAPHLTPYSPTRFAPRNALQPPSVEHLMGTDQIGRDQLTRILYGGRISLQIGVVAVLIGAVAGIVLGSIGGYFSGWVDEAISRFIDVMLAFPNILFALAVVSVLGPGMINLMIAIGVASIPGFARLTRGVVLAAREFDYVTAARALGGSHARILAKHVMPNVAPALMVYATLSMATAILSGAALSFLGLGTQPPTPEWGLMLSEARGYIRNAWWIAVFPGLMIMLAVISINLIGDAMRDVLDPWLKGR